MTGRRSGASPTLALEREPATRAGLRSQALGFVMVSHPIPSAMYVLSVAALSWIAALAAHHVISPWKLALLMAGVACTQIATGAANDVRDLELDLVGRPDKPLVRGIITPRQAAALVWLTSAGVIVFMAPLGLLPLALCVAMEGLGLAYDFGLKGTPLSALLFACFFPLIPLVAWAVFGERQAFLPWLVPVVGLLGVTMNVANSLPDLEDDIAHGISGLPHVLGVRRSLEVAWSLPLAVVALVWCLSVTRTVPAHTPGLVIATVAGAASVGLAAVLYLRGPSSSTLRATCHIQAVGVFGIGAAWLTAVAF